MWGPCNTNTAQMRLMLFRMCGPKRPKSVGTCLAERSEHGHGCIIQQKPTVNQCVYAPKQLYYNSCQLSLHTNHTTVVRNINAAIKQVSLF